MTLSSTLVCCQSTHMVSNLFSSKQHSCCILCSALAKFIHSVKAHITKQIHACTFPVTQLCTVLLTKKWMSDAVYVALA